MALNSPEWHFGRVGEEVLKEWLKAHGYFLVPASLIDNGGAPLLEGYVRKHVLPDVLASKNGRSCWVDVKSKGRFTYNQRRHRHETGFEARHLRCYQEVARLTGIACAVGFLNASDRTLYLGRLDAIVPTSHVWIWTADWAKQHPGHAFREDMVFFDRECFDWYSLADGTLVRQFVGAASEPQTIREWERGKVSSRESQGNLFGGI